MIEKIDTYFLNLFHQMSSKSNDLFFSFITWFGSLWVVLPLFCFLIFFLIRHGYNVLILPLSVGFFGCVATTYLVKYAIDRQRPTLFDPLLELPSDPSFPSAHTAQIFIFVLLAIIVLFALKSEWKIFLSVVLIGMALLVASSRIYLQVHYFSDIVGGVTLALLWAYLSYIWINK